MFSLFFCVCRCLPRRAQAPAAATAPAGFRAGAVPDVGARSHRSGDGHRLKGRFVSDLNVKDFKIFDEGKEQKIEFFTRERNQPVVVGFLLDLSNASKIHWKTYQEAAIDLISTLLPNDPKYSGYLITYSTDAEVAVNTTQDSEKLIERVRKLKAGGGAAFMTQSGWRVRAANS